MHDLQREWQHRRSRHAGRQAVVAGAGVALCCLGDAERFRTYFDLGFGDEPDVAVGAVDLQAAARALGQTGCGAGAAISAPATATVSVRVVAPLGPVAVNVYVVVVAGATRRVPRVATTPMPGSIVSE